MRISDCSSDVCSSELARALTVEPGDGDLDSLLATVDDGVLASALGGIHSGVNPISGDFSVSVEGVRVRGGERAEPIKEATLASTLQRLLLDVSHVGADVEWQPDRKSTRLNSSH